MTGRRAEFVDPTIIAKSEGRDGHNLNILSKKLINYFLVIRVSTQGFVQISFSAIFRNTKKFGYDLSKQTIIKFSEFPLDITEKDKTEDLQPKRTQKVERFREKEGTKITTEIEILEVFYKNLKNPPKKLIN